MRIKFLLVALLLISFINLRAQYEYLDTTFNNSGAVSAIKGKKFMDVFPYGSSRAVAVDQEGRIIVAAISNLSYNKVNVVRMTTEGEYGPFGDSTAITIDLNALFGITSGITISSVALQQDGKILVGLDTYLGSQQIIVVRLNQNGTIDTSFDGDGFAFLNDMESANANDYLFDILVQSDGRIVLVGTSNNKVAVARLLSNGSLDTGFNMNNRYYLSSDVNPLIVGGADIFQDQIFVTAVDNSPGYTVSLIKITAAGTPDTIFDGDERLDIFEATSCKSADVKIQPDGKILMGYSDYDSYNVYRFKTYGVVDSSFGNWAYGMTKFNTGSGVDFQDILIDREQNLLLTGSEYYTGYVVVKLASDGKPESSFGNNGRINVGGNYTKVWGSAFSRDLKLILVGEDSSNPFAAKINLRPIVHIVGKNIVQPETGEVYSIDAPESWGNNFVWNYSGDNAIIPDNNGKSVFIYFTDSTTAGELTCTMVLADPPRTYRMDIAINQKHSDAGQLAELQCIPGISDCALNYIESFKFNQINNQSSICSGSGFSDFTNSSMIDTIHAGSVYSLSLKVNSLEKETHAGIWIDYNNDGHFNSSDEFIAEKSSESPYIEIHNIILKNEPGYTGTKRLRVRCRQFGPIQAAESCQRSGENGETEDYMIIIESQQIAEAPQIMTPNDDGKNDYFVIHGIDPLKHNQLSIFDRWGEQKFSAVDYRNNWNGDDEGKKIIPGTYYYVYTANGETIRGFLEIRY